MHPCNFKRFSGASSCPRPSNLITCSRSSRCSRPSFKRWWSSSIKDHQIRFSRNKNNRHPSFKIKVDPIGVNQRLLKKVSKISQTQLCTNPLYGMLHLTTRKETCFVQKWNISKTLTAVVATNLYLSTTSVFLNKLKFPAASLRIKLLLQIVWSNKVQILTSTLKVRLSIKHR